MYRIVVNHADGSTAVRIENKEFILDMLTAIEKEGELIRSINITQAV